MFRDILFIILILINYSCCLRWTSSGLANTADTMISLKNTKEGPKVDVYKGELITIVRDISKYIFPISVHCFIAGFYANSEIEYSFCKEEACLAYADKSSQMNTNAHGLTVNIDTNIPDKKGMRVTITASSDTSDMSGNYYCKASDKTNKFFIRSNNVQIRDLLYWEQNLVLNSDDVRKKESGNVTRDLVPKVYPCFEGGLKFSVTKPIWINQEFITPVSWSVCPVKNNYPALTAKDRMSFMKCVEYTVRNWQDSDNTLKPRPLSDMTQWQYAVNSDGQLIIFDVNPESKISDLTYSLMCYRKNSEASAINAITTYIYDYDEGNIIKGVSLLGTPSEFKNNLEAISPTTQNVNIYARKVISEEKPKPVTIYALYRASSSAQATWKFNGVILNNAANRKSDKYRVDFSGDITSDMAGSYALEITDNGKLLTLTIVVTVLGPPAITDVTCLPLIRYVMENQGTSFSCTYSGKPTELKLGINGEEMKLDPQFSSSSFNIQKTYPYLSELNFTVSPSIYTVSDQVTMTYNAYNLRKTPGQVVYQDHTVMFFVKNDFGLSLSSSSIYIVPKLKPLIIDSPEAYNCTTLCSSTVKHIFKCKIDKTLFDNKELVVDHYWTVNSHRLEDLNNPQNLFAKYFTVDPITKDLTLNAFTNANNSKDDDFVKGALKDSEIICHLDLKGATEALPVFNYYSSNDIELGNQLKAKITLDYQPINTAYIYWVVAVILALIILIILIVLLTRYCMRNKGETYQLDKIERKHGYDPEKEVQEEMFKPYEREEHDGDVMSDDTNNRKMSISGHSVGSNDDGELDNYELDPSNFNEDGSIIGKYGANPRSRAAMT